MPKMTKIEKKKLQELYTVQRLSMKEVASTLNCSIHKVQYWMDRYGIPRRSRSEALYCKNNPHGDPFNPNPKIFEANALLFGIGIGLYWGEGNKANKYSVRLGNTDPDLIKVFIKFLIEIYDVSFADLRFGLQIFSDVDAESAKKFWMTKVGAESSQFYKITVTISTKVGTYRHKNKNGVLTVYFHNKKFRDIIVNEVQKCRDSSVGRAHAW